MAGNFDLKSFRDIDINDPFFDSLKADYSGSDTTPSFEKWFSEKAKENRTALVFYDDDGLVAFICIKQETESITLNDRILPKNDRYKISTIKIAERFRGQRIGEGALGLVLWKWQESDTNEIYVTVFEKHELLISQLTKFGFIMVGKNLNGENVYVKSRKNIDYSDPYKSFPFINPQFEKSGYICVNDFYHDTLFPYSELKNTLQNSVAMNVRNGFSKIYVGKQTTPPSYKIGEPVLIYRVHTGNGPKKYKSCLTSFCIITNIIAAKQYGRYLISFDDLITKIGNKSVFDKAEIQKQYQEYNNMFVIEMLYYGYFGAGNNINNDWLIKNGYWCQNHGVEYPTLIRLSPNEFKQILREGNINVNNVIIN